MSIITKHESGPSEGLFRQMAEMLPTPICGSDLDMKVKYLNGAAMDIFGLTQEDLERGLYMTQFIHPTQRHMALDRLHSLAQGEVLPQREYRFVRKDGTEFTGLIAGGLIQREGKPQGFIHFILDIVEQRKGQDLFQTPIEAEDTARLRTTNLEMINRKLWGEVRRRQLSEQALGHTLSVMQAAFDASTDGLLVVDNQDYISFVNRNFQEMWDLPPAVVDSADAKAILDLIVAHSAAPALVRRRLGMARSRPADNLNFNLVLQDGRVFEVHSRPQRLEGSIIGRVWSLREITERVKAERAQRQSEKRYRQLVENAQEAIAVVCDGQIVFFNQQMLVLTGADRRELSGKRMDALAHSEDLAELDEEQSMLLGRKQPNSSLVFRMRSTDGSWKWVESKAVLIEWEDRPATLHLLNDITEHKRASAALRESLQTLRATLAASPVGIGFVNDGILWWANPAMHDILGHSQDDLIGRPIAPLFPNRDEYRRVKQLASFQLAHRGEAAVFSRMQRKGGTTIDVQMRGRQLDASDASQGLIAVVIDISERKRAMEALLAYQEQLRRLIHELNVTSERERSRIASDLHDGLGQDLALMRIKLQTMLGAMGRPSKAGLRELLHSVDKALQDAKALVWDLSSPMLRELGLAPALDRLAEQMEGKHGIPVSFDLINQPVPLNQTQADSIFRIARELCLNALKHSGCSHIKILLSFNKNRLVLVVEDDGLGFDASQIEGYQAKGFGLFNMRGLVDSMNGTSMIESWPGRGTKVRLVVPLTIFS